MPEARSRAAYVLPSSIRLSLLMTVAGATPVSRNGIGHVCSESRIDKDLAAQLRPAGVARADGEPGGARSTGAFARDHQLLRLRTEVGSVLDGPPERGQLVVMISRRVGSGLRARR